MAVVSKSAVCLRFAGDDLVPAEVTAMLGTAPSLAYAKGETWRTLPRGPVLGHTGLWTLEVGARAPADVDGQIAELFSIVSAPLTVWRELADRFAGELFVGLFIEGGNQGLLFSPSTLASIAERGLALDLDLYGA